MKNVKKSIASKKVRQLQLRKRHLRETVDRGLKDLGNRSYNSKLLLRIPNE